MTKTLNLMTLAAASVLLVTPGMLRAETTDVYSNVVDYLEETGSLSAYPGILTAFRSCQSLWPLTDGETTLLALQGFRELESAQFSDWSACVKENYTTETPSSTVVGSSQLASAVTTTVSVISRRIARIT
ncbi:MAG: hypothetical protein H7831_16785, partial [Magnetococcus sp. WYHC-3]